MGKYSCEKCAKTFSQKSHYDKHIGRKNPCEIQTDKIKALIDKALEEKLNKLNIKLKLNITESNITINITEQMDISKMSKIVLLEKCKELGITKCSSKNKPQLIEQINSKKKLQNVIEEYKPQLIEQINSKKKLQNVIEEYKNFTSQSVNSNADKLKMIDLFAGTGAFTLAFQSTNAVNVVFANDMVAHSKTSYDENFNHTLTLKDLNEVNIEDIPPHDILTGGFPCQPFSIAGLQEGFKDERSNVFWKILSIIDRHQPKCVILENVKNLLSHDEHKTFNTIKSNLEKRGYNICYKILNTADITGIPQHRERIYIVCIKSKNVFEKFTLDFPKIEKRKISEFFENDIPEKYYYTDKSSTWNIIKESVVKKDTIYQYRRVYVRENKSSECPTLTANMGGGGHNVPLILDTKGIRKLTPRECFNLQGFPLSYKLPNLSDTNLYKLAGNAVSVPVVNLIANRIIPLLQED
jgi:DNA (cytosine-5)-methyltransferase 1